MADTNEKSPSQLVVVGSSAGGIEALSTLVSTLVVPFPAPIVIAQHLDPSRPSHLGEILARRTSLPVVSVRDHEPLHSSTVYVVPSNNHVKITDHDITLLPDGNGRPKPSVDLLLSSASEIFGEQLIAVILTGTGSDGTVGARAVKRVGGTVVIQNPDTAAYPGMPQSLEPQMVDVVADIQRIGPILYDLLTGVSVPAQPEAMRELQSFLDKVREYSDIDFKSYKPATIMRRLQRRIIATNSGDLAGYVRHIESHPEEYQRLVSNFLIKVTEFMRDPELFDILRKHVLPELIAYSRTHNNELRIWSAGCATGEEAFSLAILVCEALKEELDRFTIKIFATDLDSDAVAFARRGLYPADALGGLSDEIVARYFTKMDGSYEVRKWVRGLVIFGEHDLGQRAPFPRIDLVTCRNVLIYFSKELQQHALRLFAFALREGGYLALGKTESVSPLAEFFTPQQHNYKIYRRKGGHRPAPPFHVTGIGRVTPLAHLPDQRQHKIASGELFNVQQEALYTRLSKENLLQNLPVGVVVVDRRYDIQEINNAARRLLGIHTPVIGEDFVHLAQHISPGVLRAAIDRTIRENVVTSLNEVQVPYVTTGETSYLQLSCHPQVGTEGTEGMEGDEGGGDAPVTVTGAMVLVADVTQMVRARHELEQAHEAQRKQAAELARSVADLQATNAGLADRNGEIQQTTAELEQAKRHAEEVAAHHAQQVERLVKANQELLAANEELSSANAVLRATSEEFQVTNEEAQAAVEEVETLNEEMQATNEELETLNEEMQATIEELNTSNSDLAARSEELQALTASLESQQQHIAREKAQLEAILAGMADAVLVVTPEGAPMLTNAAYKRLFGNGDIARLAMVDENARPLPLDDMPWARAARGEMFSMTFIFTGTDGDRRWCEASGQPVRGEDGAQWGVVVMRDITERSLRLLQEQFTALANHELRTPLTSIQGFLNLLERWLKNQDQKDSGRALHYVTVALSQAHRMARLINDLLDVSRLESGKLNLQFAPMDLDTLLKQAVEVGQALTQNQEIALTIAAGSESLTINGDAERLQQVMLNLLNNAVVHAPTSKRIDVRLRRADGVAENGVAEIEVQDYGDGIEAEHLPDIFSRFYQVSKVGPVPSQGMGLGLFISQQIVEAHGGTLTVESTVGEGATFTVRLPLLEQAKSKGKNKKG